MPNLLVDSCDKYLHIDQSYNTDLEHCPYCDLDMRSHYPV